MRGWPERIMKIVRTSMKVLNIEPVKIRPRVESKFKLLAFDGDMEFRKSNQP